LLSGLLVCQQCGSAYCGRRHRLQDKHYVYYRCLGTDPYRHAGARLCTNRSVNGRVEEAVWSDACALLQDPDRLRREFERRLDGPQAQEQDATHLHKAIAHGKRRLARLLDAYEQGWLEKAEVEPRLQRVKEQLQRDQEALAQHQNTLAADEELRLLCTDFTAFAHKMSAGLEQADFITRRKLLRLLIHRIEVNQDAICIVYKVALRPFVPSPDNRGFLQDCVEFPVTPSE
jgi:site-specific DNA recombinase